MPGVELSIGECDGHVVVALRGELDVTGAPRPHARRLLTLTGQDQDEVFWGSGQRGGRGRGVASCREQGRLARPAVSTARPWEGSAVEYRYRIIGAGSSAVPAEGRAPGPGGLVPGACRGRIPRWLTTGPQPCGGSWPRMPPGRAPGCRSPTSARSRSARLSWPGGGGGRAQWRPGFRDVRDGPGQRAAGGASADAGEGPCHDVLASAAPVLAADLGDAESGRRWPAFTPEARQLGAGAVFAFPLIVGAIRAGVLGLYRGSPGPLRAGSSVTCSFLPMWRP